MSKGPAHGCFSAIVALNKPAFRIYSTGFNAVGQGYRVLESDHLSASVDDFSLQTICPVRSATQREFSGNGLRDQVACRDIE